VLGGVPEVWVALGGLIILGGGYAVMEIAGWTLLQRLSADDVLARVTGVMESSYWVTNGIGALLAPVLVSAVGTRWSLAIVGALLPLVVVARRRALARLESGRPVPERPYQLLRSLPLFAPLPLGTVENLALRVSEVGVGAETKVITEGQSGDRFYLVDSGELEITRGGRYRDTIGGGDFFGEIALLRGVPRTATVTAKRTCRLYALERDAFLDAIGAHARSSQAAESAAVERSWEFAQAK
jgi:MFS family permease